MPRHTNQPASSMFYSLINCMQANGLLPMSAVDDEDEVFYTNYISPSPQNNPFLRPWSLLLLSELGTELELESIQLETEWISQVLRIVWCGFSYNLTEHTQLVLRAETWNRNMLLCWRFVTERLLEPIGTFIPYIFVILLKNIGQYWGTKF